MGYQSDTIVTKADRGPCENEGWLQDLLSVEEVVVDAVLEIAFPLKSKADNKLLGWMQDFKRKRFKIPIAKRGPLYRGSRGLQTLNSFKIEALGSRVSSLLRPSQSSVMSQFFQFYFRGSTESLAPT